MKVVTLRIMLSDSRVNTGLHRPITPSKAQHNTLDLKSKDVRTVVKINLVDDQIIAMIQGIRQDDILHRPRLA